MLIKNKYDAFCQTSYKNKDYTNYAKYSNAKWHDYTSHLDN